MALADQQRVLARLCIDSRLRERFRTDPARVADELAIPAADRSWFDALSGQELARFAASLQRKRFQEIVKLLPASARLLDLRFDHPHWQRFRAQELPLDPDAFTSAIRFADWMAGSTELAGTEASFSRDVLRYEQARLQAVRARWLVRLFRYPVGEGRTRILRESLAGSVAAPRPRYTVAIWFRPSRLGRLRHWLFYP